MKILEVLETGGVKQTVGIPHNQFLLEKKLKRMGHGGGGVVGER
jgi:hypothetical protein